MFVQKCSRSKIQVLVPIFPVRKIMFVRQCSFQKIRLRFGNGPFETKEQQMMFSNCFRSKTNSFFGNVPFKEELFPKLSVQQIMCLRKSTVRKNVLSGMLRSKHNVFWECSARKEKLVSKMLRSRNNGFSEMLSKKMFGQEYSIRKRMFVQKMFCSKDKVAVLRFPFEKDCLFNNVPFEKIMLMCGNNPFGK